MINDRKLSADNSKNLIIVMCDTLSSLQDISTRLTILARLRSFLKEPVKSTEADFRLSSAEMFLTGP